MEVVLEKYYVERNYVKVNQIILSKARSKHIFYMKMPVEESLIF